MVEYIESSLDQGADNIGLVASRVKKKKACTIPKYERQATSNKKRPHLVSSEDNGLIHYAHSQRTLSTGERSTRTFDPKRVSNNDRRIPRKAQSGKLGNGVVTSLGGGIIP